RLRPVFTKNSLHRASSMNLQIFAVRRRFGLLSASICLWIASANSLLQGAVGVGALPNPMTMEAVVRGQRIEATPLAFSKSEVYLMKRDGGMIEFSPAEAQDFRKISDGFTPYPQSFMRGQLEREFGPQLEVSSTAHFLVVHPKNQPQWTERFEEM